MGPEPLDEILASVIAFRGRPRDSQTGQQLGAELIKLRHISDQIELAFSETAAAFAATDEYERQDSTTPIDWIRHRCKMTASQAADRVNVGEQLPKLPQSAAAVGEGSIGFAHLSVIARTVSALDQAPQSIVGQIAVVEAANDPLAADDPLAAEPVTGGVPTAFNEGAVLAWARASSVGKLWHFCVRLRHALNQQLVVNEQRAAVERRWLRLTSTEDGMVRINGELDAVGGAVLRTALEPLARPSGQSDERGSERRLADAQVELAQHALDAGQVPQTASQRPHLQVTTTLETLRGLRGSPAADLEFSQPISAETVQRLACDGNITRVVFGPNSQVVDVGRARRVVSGPARRALNARDQWCRWPGCERPASWSAAHHVVHWVRGGATDLSNMILLCHRHHFNVHEGGWQLARATDQTLLVIPPAFGYVPWGGIGDVLVDRDGPTPGRHPAPASDRKAAATEAAASDVPAA